MKKREKIQELRLNDIETEFRALLHSCLRECAQGRWGLFGQNDHLDPDGSILGWPDAKRLRCLAEEIKSLRHEFGQTNDLSERFLQLCAERGANALGEPKLAAAFLTEISEERPGLPFAGEYLRRYELNLARMQEVEAWRTSESDAGRPSSLKDYFAAHGFCSYCHGVGLAMNADGMGYKAVGWDRESQLFEQCDFCEGTGVSIEKSS